VTGRVAREGAPDIVAATEHLRHPATIRGDGRRPAGERLGEHEAERLVIDGRTLTHASR